VQLVYLCLSITMSDVRHENWKTLYDAALLELDQERLPSRIRLAEEAIQRRLAFLSGSSDYHAERRAIEDAMQNLRVLRQTELTQEEI
jgi:hypothetical protein